MGTDPHKQGKDSGEGLRFDLGVEVAQFEIQTKAFQLQVKPGNASCKILFSVGLVTWAFKSFSAFEACEIHNGHKANV